MWCCDVDTLVPVRPALTPFLGGLLPEYVAMSGTGWASYQNGQKQSLHLLPAQQEYTNGDVVDVWQLLVVDEQGQSTLLGLLQLARDADPTNGHFNGISDAPGAQPWFLVTSSDGGSAELRAVTALKATCLGPSGVACISCRFDQYGACLADSWTHCHQSLAARSAPSVPPLR